MIELNKLLPKDIRKMISELTLKLYEIENSIVTIGKVVDFEKEIIYCPKCGSVHVIKDGKYKKRQKYKCKDCNKKFNSLTNTPFHHTRLTYKQIEIAYQCLVDKLTIRKSAIKIGVSTRTAFTLRFKLISTLKNKTNKKLSGNIELDEYYLSVNLKGTKSENMPRISKPRAKNGTGKQGINKHQICITSGIDECDNIILRIAGTGNVTSKMIENTILPRIYNPKKIITDCKSSYERIANENKWLLKQVKSKSYADKEGNNLANINSLHSCLSEFLSRFRGVSSKHLQEYLDWFVFSKYQDYSINYLEQADNFEKQTITEYTAIKYCNVYDNYSGLDFNKLYEDYCYQPSNSTT